MKSSIQTNSSALTTVQSPSPAAQPPPPPVELLTQVEMAQRLGITRRTLHAWVLSGAVPMIKIRGFCRFEPAKVWAALLQHEVNASGTAKSSSSASCSSSREGDLNAAATPSA